MQRKMPFLFALSILAACGGKTVTIPDDANGVTESDLSVEQACAEQSSASCALRDICSGAVVNQIAYGSTSLCVSRLTASCVANMASPETGNNVAHIHGCSQAYAGESCADWWDVNTVHACRSVAGPRSNGAVCGVNSQCASAFCAAGANAECGVCQSAPQAGMHCEASSDCQYDLTCPIAAGATSGVCTPRSPAQGPCDTIHPCAGGLACIGANASKHTMGSCQPAATEVGTRCNYETGPGCDNSRYLTCASGTCQKEVLAAAGQPCGNLGSVGYVSCGAGAACMRIGEIATCVDPAADGAACDSVKGPLCLSPAKCITASGGTAGTCTFPNPASCN